MESGGSYGYFRLSSGPRHHPTSSSDRLAAQLIRYLEKDPYRNDLHNVGYLQYLPRRLGHSSALRDSVALFCSAWFNFRRSMPANDLVVTCSESYGRAIRSLQRALNRPEEQLRCETLAATTLLERFQVLFDPQRGPQRRSLHAKGIHTIMMLRGPPNLDDELDLWLAMENQATLLSYWVVEGCDNFFLQPEWKKVIAQARTKAISGDIRGQFKAAYDLDAYYEQWPTFTREIQAIYADPTSVEMQARAVLHYQKLCKCSVEIQEIGGTLIEKAFGLSLITEVSDAECPGGSAYDFQMIDFCGLVAGILSMRLLLLQMICDVSELVKSLDESPQEDLARLSHEVCMLTPYLRQQGPIACLLYITPFYLAFNADPDQVERDYIIDFIIWVDKYRQRLPGDRAGVEYFVLKTVSGLTGRVSFDQIPYPKLG